MIEFAFVSCKRLKNVYFREKTIINIRAFIVCISILVVSTISALLVQQHMYGAPIESHHHKRWWNAEALLHFSNTLGRYYYQSIDKHYFAIGMVCDAPESAPCTSLDKFDLNDKEILAINAVAPSARIGNEGVYTSFPPGAFIVSYRPVYAMAEIFNIHPNSALRVWNRFLQLITTLFMFFTIFRLIPPDTKYREVISGLSVLPMILSVEQFHAHHTAMWAHQVYQPFIAATLLLLTFKPTMRNVVILGIISAIGSWIEWTAYLVCIGVSFAVLACAPKGQKLKRVVVFGGISVLGGISLLAYYAWLVGIETYLYNLTIRFSSRTFVDYYTWYDWVVSLTQSYGAWLLVIFIAMIVAVITPFSKRLDKAWIPIILISGFILIENILMFEHAITYTFDRLKWGFLTSTLLAVVTVRLADPYPKASVVALGGMCFIASWLSVVQFSTIYVRYW